MSRETPIRQLISALVRQNRPQFSYNSRRLQHPHRSIATANVTAGGHEHTEIDWTQHRTTSGQVAAAVAEPESRVAQLRKEVEPKPFSSFLTDNFSRQHNYLRISITERCNLRCLYCMPEEGIQLSPADHLLTTPEIVHLSSIFVNQGVDKIRLTGGEPTVRKDIVDLMQQIGELRKNGLKELCLTTNGISLYRKLDAMAEAGLTGVNLSLDTLDPFQFTLMTRRNGHEAVMKSIRRILEMNKLGAGITLKINCVVMRGMNEREILPFVEMTRTEDLEVRFIEYMPFDGNKWSEKKMMSFKEMLALIRSQYPDVHRVTGHANDTSKTYKVPGFAGRLGFITSMTHNFCGSCNRLRITSDGNLKVCLFGNSEVSLRDILRESNEGRPIDAEAMEAVKQLEIDRQRTFSADRGDLEISPRDARLLDVIGMAVKRKKEKHAGIGELENMKNRPMILIDEASFLSRKHVQGSATAFGSSSVPWAPNVIHLAMPPISLNRPFAQIAQFSTCPVLTRNVMRGNATLKEEMDSSTSSHATNRPTTGDATPARLTHLTSSGEAHMVSISAKSPTVRVAVATAKLLFSNKDTYDSLLAASLKKGDALAVARVAGIMAAKKTSDLIPLAHPGLGITSVSIDIVPIEPTELSSSAIGNDGRHLGGVQVSAQVACEGKTGVEMEAMMAASVAGLTMYDMLKGVDKGMVLSQVRVIEKKGGKSGDWRWDEDTQEIVKSKSVNHVG